MKGDKVKIAIGAPTYNSVERLQSLLTSIEYYTADFRKDVDYKVVVLDDGTRDIEKRKEVAEMALRFGVDFIQHDENEGIPASWNDLSRHYLADIVVIFNDDVQVCDSNWLKCAVYALENNEKVASVGFPLIHMDPITKMRNFNIDFPDLENPGRVGACVGCAFCMKTEIFEQVGSFDENIKSFYEEIDQGFRFAKAGYYSVMLPFPPVEHYGSQSFGQNIELCLQRPIENVLSMQKYKEIMSKKFPMERIEPVSGWVYRMDYSRIYFGLKWNCSDLTDAPQIEIHNKYVNILSKIKFRYLDKNLDEKECQI